MMTANDNNSTTVSEKVNVKARKPRDKKSDKFSQLYFIPRNVLNEVQKNTNKKARQGFQTYKSLSCQQCKNKPTFHKRSGLESHTIEVHGGNNHIKKKSHNSTVAKNNKRNTLNISTVEIENEDDISIIEDFSPLEIIHSTPKPSISDKIERIVAEDDDSGIEDVEYINIKDNKNSDIAVIELSMDQDDEDLVILTSTPKSSSFEKNNQDCDIEEIECVNVEGSSRKNEAVPSRTSRRRRDATVYNSVSEIIQSEVDESIEAEMAEPSSSLQDSIDKSGASVSMDSLEGEDSIVDVKNKKRKRTLTKNQESGSPKLPKVKGNSKLSDPEIIEERLDENNEVEIVEDSSSLIHGKSSSSGNKDSSGEGTDLVEDDSGVAEVDGEGSDVSEVESFAIKNNKRKRRLGKNKDTTNRNNSNCETIESNVDENRKSSNSRRMNPVVNVQNINVMQKNSLRKNEDIFSPKLPKVTPRKSDSNSEKVVKIDSIKESGRKRSSNRSIHTKRSSSETVVPPNNDKVSSVTKDKVSKVIGRKRKADLENEDDKVVKFSTGEWEWMINYPMFTPEIWLAGDLNKALRAAKDDHEKDSKDDHIRNGKDGQDSDIEMLDQEEVPKSRKRRKSHVKSTSPLKNNNEKDAPDLTEVSPAVLDEDVTIVDLESDGEDVDVEDDDYILEDDEVELFKDKLKNISSGAPQNVSELLISDCSDDEVECLELS